MFVITRIAAVADLLVAGSIAATRLLAVALLALAGATLLFGPASLAQTAPASASAPQDTAAFSLGFDMALTLHADKTAEFVETRRIKVLGVAALQQVAQQTVGYVEGMQSFEVVAAFTEKAGGTRISVDPSTVITRDGATGLSGVYLRDLKLVTVIFPDVSVGDTLVLTTRKTMHSDTFAGQFEQFIPFSRVIQHADSTVRVVAPSTLKLKVGVHGEGMEHTTAAVGNETRHLITYHAQPMVPAEERMTASLDRDPGVSISTFEDYRELARSYWDAARSAIEVTPEIARLADDITRGSTDKRTQAKAISNWVKSNIRYVFIVLGTTRVVPHNASDVLKNRYGDCKDHAVLMSALLAAKGIAVEHVLINGGYAYTLPEPAAMGALNHVMLYLPELGLYDDSTAQFASFGVLPDAGYDKPVIHVSDRGAYTARTPAMHPEDHVSTRRTRMSVSADGTVSGETDQFGTGVFALNARIIAAAIQRDGLARSAEDLLRRFGSPGKGTFEIGSLTDLGDSYTVRAKFTYDTRMPVRAPAIFTIPAGLGIQGRPGDYVLATRNPSRKQPFVCLAGTQIEEIELIFAPGLPLPQRIDGRRIESKSFVYSATYRLENRTLKVRRELVSRVPSQACGTAVEAEIAQPMRDVVASNATAMVFPAQPAPAQWASATPAQAPSVPATADTLEAKRVAIVDRPLQVDFVTALNPDCSLVGVTSVRTIEEPRHGKLTVEKGWGFANYPQDNPRAACGRRRSEGMQMSYRPDPGYLGPDSVTVDVIYGDGYSRKRHYEITVNPKPPPFEATRVVIAEQPARIGFLVNLDPDCSVNPMRSVRIVEEPKHGKGTVERGPGFTNFPKDNPRFECNKQRSEGSVVWYQAEAGYIGKDSLMVEVVYPDGREATTHYSIEVRGYSTGGAAAPPTPPQHPAVTATSNMQEAKRVATVDQPLRVDFQTAINPDCSPVGVAGVLTVEEPQHGKVTVEKGSSFTTFAEDNPRSACNRRRSDGVLMSYRSDPGYLGPDSVTVDVIYGDGSSRKVHYAITVNPKPPPFEVTRVAVAEQRARIGFMVNLDPDCSSTPFRSARVVEEPKHGTGTVEPGTGFTNFAKDNPRFECNKQRSEGSVVWYQAEAGYTGKDSLTVEVVYPDGRESSMRYSIDVK